MPSRNVFVVIVSYCFCALRAGGVVTGIHFRGCHVVLVLGRLGVDSVRVQRGRRGGRVSASADSLNGSLPEAARAVRPDRALCRQLLYSLSFCYCHCSRDQF